MTVEEKKNYNLRVDGIELAKLGYTIESTLVILNVELIEVQKWTTPKVITEEEQKKYECKIAKIEKEFNKKINSKNFKEHLYQKYLTKKKKDINEVPKPKKVRVKGEFENYLDTYNMYYRKSIIDIGKKLMNADNVTATMKLIELGTTKIYKDNSLKQRSGSRDSVQEAKKKEKQSNMIAGYK